MNKNFKFQISNLTLVSFVLFILSVPFSYAYSLNFLEESKSYTSFPLYNIYFIDAAAIFFLLATLINSYWHKKSFFAPLFFCRDALQCVSTFAIFVALSFLWSGSPFLSAFWGLRLIIIVSALILLAGLVRKSNVYRDLFFKIFITAGVIESLIALSQFFLQRSLGLSLLGESYLGPDVLGLTRVDLLGRSLLRAYGTFPHPNLLGGFLLLTLAATVWYKPAKFQKILLIAQLIGLGLTFSRSAILGLSIIILLAFLSSRASAYAGIKRSPLLSSLDSRPNDSAGRVTRGSRKRISNCFWITRPALRRRLRPASPKLQRGEQGESSRVMTMVAFLIILFSLLLVRSPIQIILSGKDSATRLRVEYAAAAYHRFIASPVFGRGWGTGPVELPAFSNFFFYSWELQPVHNIYLLVLSDLGIAGLILFLYFIYQVTCRNAQKLVQASDLNHSVLEISGSGRRLEPTKQCASTQKNNIWKYLFIAYLFIGLFDHYLLTLPQGMFIFFASAFLVSSESERKTEKTPRRV